MAASTQNQALNAVLFLYRVVLEQDLRWLNEVVRPRLMALLLYGAGLRLLECARLRVKDVDFASRQIVVRSGKGAGPVTSTLRHRGALQQIPERPGPVPEPQPGTAATEITGRH